MFTALGASLSISLMFGSNILEHQEQISSPFLLINWVISGEASTRMSVILANRQAVNVKYRYQWVSGPWMDSDLNGGQKIVLIPKPLSMYR